MQRDPRVPNMDRGLMRSMQRVPSPAHKSKGELITHETGKEGKP